MTGAWNQLLHIFALGVLKLQLDPHPCIIQWYFNSTYFSRIAAECLAVQMNSFDFLSKPYKQPALLALSTIRDKWLVIPKKLANSDLFLGSLVSKNASILHSSGQIPTLVISFPKNSTVSTANWHLSWLRIDYVWLYVWSHRLISAEKIF